MQTITAAVRAIISNDEIVREAALRGLLNSSAYAREIASEVQNKTWKEVEERSITVAINRVIQEKKWLTTRPKISFDKVSVETGLVDVTYEKTAVIKKQFNAILPVLRNNFTQDLFIETSGQHQTTMVLSQRMWQEFQQQTSLKPMAVFENVVAISVSFDGKYLAIPNFIYAVLGILAIDNINIIEIFSTLTELTLVIRRDDVDTALSRIKQFMK